jgi:hypothetical protein
MKFASLCCGLVIFAQTLMFAQSNPVPFVNQILDPVSVQPGGKEFVLTVNGTGFASTAVINWNGSPILTSVESANQLKARISAAKIKKAGTVSVTVTNPAPGGGTSSAVYLPIRTAFSTVAFSPPTNFSSVGNAVTVGDFNNDGKLDIALGESYQIEILLGNGDGTFQSLAPFSAPFAPYSLLAADFNGDGRLDLAVSNGYTISIFLGNGDGTFSQGGQFTSSAGAGFMAAGDFNGDGKLDLYAASQFFMQFIIYLGNGDGTFQATQPVTIPGTDTAIPGVGDFNGDGILDLALGSGLGGPVNIFLGNGDGSFQSPVSYPAGYGGVSVTAADMNGDGKLDLATYSWEGAAILLGKGDGTFTLAGEWEAYSGDAHNKVNVGDLNGDGKADMAVIWPQIGNLDLFLGNGDGTFQNPIQFTINAPYGSSLGFSMGDFNGDGRFDLVLAGGTLYLQTSVTASPASVDFGDQTLGTKSAQGVTLTNLNSSAVKVDFISIVGIDSQDFVETNHCKSLPALGTCDVKVTFAPQAIGLRTAALNIVYQDKSSPLAVPLSGIGVTTTVSLTPSNLRFPAQLVGTTSPEQATTLANTGTQAVSISSITVKAPFTQTNDCPASLPAGSDCDILVRFTPHAEGPAKGTLSVSDDATGSPQKVSLSGVGTVVTFSPEGVNFGDQKVGTSSPPAPVELFNKGGTTLSITQITIGGTNSGDFAQKNNCGQSVPAHGHCTITVTFKPTATGQRSAYVSVTDDGGGSPQSVPLAGTGT